MNDKLYKKEGNYWNIKSVCGIKARKLKNPEKNSKIPTLHIKDITIPTTIFEVEVTFKFTGEISRENKFSIIDLEIIMKNNVARWFSTMNLEINEKKRPKERPRLRCENKER